MRKLPGFLIVLFIALITFGLAQAHGIEPVQASPGDGEILRQSPTQIRLVFEEEIGEEGSMLQVFNEQGQRVNETGGVDLYDPEHVTLISDLPELPQGVYLAKWKVTLGDGDSSQGQYYFGVGEVVLPQLSEQIDAAEAPQNYQDATGRSAAELLLVVSALLFATGFAIYRIRRSMK